MARHTVTTVVVEVLETTGGHWCTGFLLPSGWLKQRPWCDECGRRDTVVPG